MGAPTKPEENGSTGGLFPFLVEMILPDGAAIKVELKELTQTQMVVGVAGSINDGVAVRIKLQFRCDDIMEISEMVSGRVVQIRSAQGQDPRRIRIILDSPLTPQTHPVLFTHLEHPPAPPGQPARKGESKHG